MLTMFPIRSTCAWNRYFVENRYSILSLLRASHFINKTLPNNISYAFHCVKAICISRQIIGNISNNKRYSFEFTNYATFDLFMRWISVPWWLFPHIH